MANTSSRDREITDMIKAEGLAIARRWVNGSGHISIDVQAANGAEKNFVFSKTPKDHRANIKARALLRRFARECAPPPAASAPPAPEKRLPPPLYCEEPPQRLAPIVNAAAIAVLLPPTTKPTTMNKPAETTVTEEKTARNQMSHAEFYKLCEWVKTANLDSVYTYNEVARLATAGTGKLPSWYSIRQAMIVTGRELSKKPVGAPTPPTANERILATSLIAMMEQLDLPVSEELRQLAQ